MPTSATIRYTEDYLMPFDTAVTARTISVRIQPSTYVAKGAFLQQVGGSPGVFQPVPVGVAGTPTTINKRDLITDASGNITFGSPATGMDQAQTYFTADAYYAGVFIAQDLVQTGAGAITAAYFQSNSGRTIGELVSGTITQGIVQIF